jgi:hypothetical protein
MPTDELKISDQRPIPKARSKYPWKTLEVGQSFLFPPWVTPQAASTMVRQASTYNHPKEYRAGKTEEGGVIRWYAIRVK